MMGWLCVENVEDTLGAGAWGELASIGTHALFQSPECHSDSYIHSKWPFSVHKRVIH